jgi:hypothetical protein
VIKSFKQISVFVENKPGRLAKVTGILNEHKINMHALSLADTADYGIMRFITDDPEQTKLLLRENGFLAKTNTVAAVSLSHEPGSLHNLLCQLADEQISIEYMYAFTSRLEGHDAIVILRLADYEEAIPKMRELGIKLIDEIRL